MPISRRAAIVSGAALAGGVVMSSIAAPQLRDHHLLRTRNGYVRYEQLYRSGDSVSDALARLTEPRVVVFPEGRFVCSDFNSGYLSGISIPPQCRGIVGAGRGELGGSSGTVFTMKPGSSTKGGGARDSAGRLYVPLQDDHTPCQLNLIKQLNQDGPSVWQDFQVAGTEQGHIFGGIQIYNTAGANEFDNILVTGWDGNAGAPPGETFGLAVSGPGEHQINAVECDGRRVPDGEVFGAMGMTVQNTVGVTFRNCSAHHCRAASFVAFQSFDGVMIGCRSDADVPDDRAVGNGGLNFERTAGWQVVDCTINGRLRKVHVTHSNDRWTLQQGGRSYSVVNGSLTLTNPTYNDLWGDDLLMIQSWTPYWTGDSMRTPPDVTAFEAALPYVWVHGVHNLIN